jgi:hypothetical protein
MSQSLKGKTQLSLSLQPPVLHNYFNKEAFPGRCRKEFSPGYKDYISHAERIQEECRAINNPAIRRIVHFSILNAGQHLNTIFVSILKNIGGFLMQYPIVKSIIYGDILEGSYNLNRKEIQK